MSTSSGAYENTRKYTHFVDTVDTDYLKNGSITGAKSKGAVRIAAGQRVLVERVTFADNRCDGNIDSLREGDVGGAIRCNGDIKLVGCTFRNNSCTTHGGAVGIYSNDFQSRYVIEGCMFEQNSAVEAGGALFLGCSGQILNTTIKNNTASLQPGTTANQTPRASIETGTMFTCQNSHENVIILTCGILAR